MTIPASELVNLPEDRGVRVTAEDDGTGQVSPDVLDWLDSLPGYSLNLSAGATARRPERCIEVARSVFPNTSVVADAHRLPFKDDVFDAVVSYNTFGHLADPALAATEIRRVLKPEGKVRLQAAFLTPLHEPPTHFYNTTEFGLRQWFDGYQIDDLFVPDKMYPPYALGWIAALLLYYCRRELDAQETADVGLSTLEYWRESWRERFSPTMGTRNLLRNLSTEAQRALGFGFELRARRPHRGGSGRRAVPEAPHPSWSSFIPLSRDRDRRLPLVELLTLLRCPRCRSTMDLEIRGDSLSCPGCGASYPVLGATPALLPEDQDVIIMSGNHRSNPFPTELFDWLESLDGYSLHLGAGSTMQRPTRCVELEYSMFRNTTVVGDALVLPFKDETFDAIVSFNTFEHLADPQTAAREVFRVLKPGGRIVIQTAFLQPLHEEPYHFYNATEHGVRHWFSEFEVDECTVPPDMTIPHMLGWLSDHILYRVEKELGTGARRLVAKTRLSQWSQYWEVPSSRHGFLQRLFDLMPAESHTHFSAGFEIRATKPPLSQLMSTSA